jgi:hypothetical protein
LPPWWEQLPLRPPEWLYAPSAHRITWPFVFFQKLAMHGKYRQNDAGGSEIRLPRPQWL